MRINDEVAARNHAATASPITAAPNKQQPRRETPLYQTPFPPGPQQVLLLDLRDQTNKVSDIRDLQRTNNGRAEYGIEVKRHLQNQNQLENSTLSRATMLGKRIPELANHQQRQNDS